MKTITSKTNEEIKSVCALHDRKGRERAEQIYCRRIAHRYHTYQKSHEISATVHHGKIS